MAKKNPYVMTIGFKKDDPDHLAVAEFLNGIGHGKAQYIVKAILTYQNLVQSGEISVRGAVNIDYQVVKNMVLQVLGEYEGNAPVVNMIRPENEGNKNAAVRERDVLDDLDDDMLNGIMESLAMFQGE